MYRVMHTSLLHGFYSLHKFSNLKATEIQWHKSRITDPIAKQRRICIWVEQLLCYHLQVAAPTDQDLPWLHTLQLTPHNK
jgi:hypothetical protein